jgi:hypothetical protein
MNSGASPSSKEQRHRGEPNRFFRRSKPKRRATRIVLWVVLAFAVVAVVVGGWALNRYVIDHVEISDVSSYESQVERDTPTVPLATFPPDNPATTEPSPPSTDPSPTTTELQPE